MEELQDELLKVLKAELKSELLSEDDIKILSLKIKIAMQEVRHKRNYQEHHTKQFVEEDMQNFYQIIYRLVVYDWNMRGVEGQNNHSENGTNRSWIDRDKIFSPVIPFVKTICK